MPLDRDAVKALVLRDLETLLQPFSPADGDGITFDDEHEGVDDPPVLQCVLPDHRERYAMRWTFTGTHTGPERGGLTGDRGIGPTGNFVEISGLSIIEVPTEIVMRYVDWLSAYAQLGIIEMRRPSVARVSVDSEGGEPTVIDWPPAGGSPFLPQV